LKEESRGRRILRKALCYIEQGEVIRIALLKLTSTQSAARWRVRTGPDRRLTAVGFVRRHHVTRHKPPQPLQRAFGVGPIIFRLALRTRGKINDTGWGILPPRRVCVSGSWDSHACREGFHGPQRLAIAHLPQYCTIHGIAIWR
jgi:hypothetical protein